MDPDVKLAKDDVISDAHGAACVLGVDSMPVLPVVHIPAVVIDEIAVDLRVLRLLPPAEPEQRVMDHHVDEFAAHAHARVLSIHNACCAMQIGCRSGVTAASRSRDLESPEPRVGTRYGKRYAVIAPAVQRSPLIWILADNDGRRRCAIQFADKCSGVKSAAKPDQGSGPDCRRMRQRCGYIPGVRNAARSRGAAARRNIENLLLCTAPVNNNRAKHSKC